MALVGLHYDRAEVQGGAGNNAHTNRMFKRLHSQEFTASRSDVKYEQESSLSKSRQQRPPRKVYRFPFPCEVTSKQKTITHFAAHTHGHT
jgi:hypothetical protein